MTCGECTHVTHVEDGRDEHRTRGPAELREKLDLPRTR
ncbi:hypothetical protein IW256_000511 [Actinomadura viridis]|uniref:Uncharacterized protein n=1 Tax=Actinomadura viridis TaxID=58110 RepID=A0A931DD51_9ACTN|nr:hypothetical protein [Actinomadura viridis]